MDQEQINKAKRLVQESKILSPMERAEWLQLLPDMSGAQVLELLEILTPKNPIPSELRPVAKPVSSMPKVDITQKEISTSIPFYEPEIPAHTTVVTQPVQKQVPSPADPSELQNRVENIVKELEQRKAGKPVETEQPHIKLAEKPAVSEPVHSAPVQHAPADVLSKLHVHEDYKEPATPIEPVVLNMPADFSKLTPDYLHGQNAAQQLEKIYTAMLNMFKKYKPYDLISEFEKSPLYQTYIDMGFDLLNDPNPDRDAAYASLLSSLRTAEKPWLSKEEFELFADFRNKVEVLI